MKQYIIITKKRVYRVAGKSYAHVTQAAHDARVRALSIVELETEE